MENASKALLIAAGMLIGILILSLAVYLFATFGAYSSEVHRQQEEQNLNKFNLQFTMYQDKNDISIYDIINLANIATENNIYYQLDEGNREHESTYYVEVKIGSKSLEGCYAESKDDKYVDYDTCIKNNAEKKFTCEEVSISSKTGRVYIIKFKETK